MTQIVQLSRREQEVVGLVLQGKSNKMIAAALGISVRTVEFHLKNIYTKAGVSSRVELILKLGNPTNKAEIGKLGSSTVAKPVESSENQVRHEPGMVSAESFRNTVFWIGQELKMKNLKNNKHVLVGVLTALLAGFSWVAMFRIFENMSPNEIMPWIAPLTAIWVLIGSSIGLIGKRNGSTLPKTGFSALFGTGLSPIAILPAMGFVVMPIGKLAEAAGLIDASTMSRDTATTLAILAMLGIWLIIGIAVGAVPLFLAVRKPEQKVSQVSAS